MRNMYNETNYIFYLKQILLMYTGYILSSVITYGIMRYFSLGKPIIITEGHIHAFIGSLLGVCIFPVLRIWYDSLKSK
jgi:hypothetical protein